MKQLALILSLVAIPWLSGAHGDHDHEHATEVDQSRLTKVLFTCVNGAEEAQSFYLGMSVDGLTIRDAGFDLEAYPMFFTEPTPVNDRTSEKNRLRDDKYVINTALTITITGCDRALSSFRTITTSRAYKLDSYLTSLPFHDQCEAEDTYEVCSDQRLRYQEAWQQANTSGKKILIVYGYEGCAWCDSILSYLSTAQEIQEQYLVLDIGDASVNRTGRALIDGLFEISGEPEGWGLPLLMTVDPSNNDVQAYDIEAYELNEYNEDIYNHSYAWVNYILGIDVSCDSLRSTWSQILQADQQSLVLLQNNLDMKARQDFASQLYFNSQQLLALDNLMAEKGCR